MSRTNSHATWTIALIGALLYFLPQLALAENLTDQVDELIRSRIEAAGIPPRIEVGDELIYSSVALPLFYERRVYRPAWSDDSGPLSHIDGLITAIGLADQEGLRPGDYHLAKLQAILGEVRQNQRKNLPFNPQRLADLDLLATDAFLILGSHLLAGRINPETIDPEWMANRREADLADVLQKALDANRIEAAMKDLLPQQPGYGRLKEALLKYRQLAAGGGWPSVPEGPKMQAGARGPRVAALRSRLKDEGYLSDDAAADEQLFDHLLDQAVRQFQQHHGLDVDGVVGPATLGALNLSAQDRVRQLEVNLERWRWLPQELGQQHILVNIASFELDVVEGGQPVLVMKVVVGRDYRRTPVFSDKMTYLVLSPYWNVPLNIAVEDKLPLIKKDPAYLAKQNMRLFQGWGVNTKEIDPLTVDWSKITAKSFSYRLRQEPGAWNALGKVKFMFPNKFNVYLHDTPSRELFARPERTFSSGCIRLEKPIDLAQYLLRDDPSWTREQILAAIDKREEQTVQLPKRVPVHLLYWTAWVTEDGTVNFRKDIYGRDKLVAAALEEKPPTAD
jgi:murein L,D-transpeptidase YcbB/YkuD